MRRFLLLPMLLAACSSPAPVGNGATDINAAAVRAQGDINTYAANGEAPIADASPQPLTPAKPGEPGGLPDDRTPVSEAAFTPDSPQGAANVVQTYYALIEAGKYRQAWALWGEKGAASKQTADAFAVGFAAYSEYHANIGAPGREDAGAGQRYVTVPVQVYARRKDGSPVYWRGDVVMHRTADIDGATAEDKSWRIRSIDLKPAPAGTAG